MKATHPLLVSIALLVCLLTGGTSWAAAAGVACVHRPAPAGAVGKRIAVIVGNGAYANGIPELPNPAHDAGAVSKAVGELGFEVFLSTDADSKALQQCLDEAYAHLADADVAMLYYSGHGIQIKDENYLVATDARSSDLEHGFVPVQPIVDALQKRAKATLVLLDACRNNPMAEAGHAGLSVSTGRGLARMKDAPVAGTPDAVQARGLMVAYSTSPNAVALDGTGAFSPFTGAFVKAVGTSGYSIQRVMSDVTKAVGEQTDWAQTPWMKSSLTNELKLGGGETLAEAQSISDNHAARSESLLGNDGNKQGAIIEALKGLPAAPDETALKRFAKAYLAVYSAMQNREIKLPLSPGMTRVAVSTQNRAAIYKLGADYTSGEFDLWSVTDKTIVAKPTVGRSVSEFTFSPHGKFLAVVAGGGTSVLNGIDGAKLFDLRGRASNAEFSPDESHLLLVGEGALAIVDVATGKPSMVIKTAQLTGGKGRSGSIVQANFGSDETICFTLETGGYGPSGKRAIGVFDLEEQKTTRLRETNGSVTVTTCDPAGKYMVRTFAVGDSDSGMEIWDLVHDKVTRVNEPIVNISGIDPRGNYVSVIAFSSEAKGFYDLATGKKGHPETVPEGYVISGGVVHNETGGLVSQDITPNAWRDWPDETLYGPALVKKAMAGLTDAQRAEIARERITFSEVAANP